MRWEAATARGRGVNLHVRRVVDPPAPPALLLHGLGVSGSVLQPFARRLLPELAAVVPDLRGHGASDAPPSGYAPDDYAADLAELIESERLAPVPVIGHSLGALVGNALAAERPELVRWLVLLDPPFDAEVGSGEPADVYRLRHSASGELERYLLERNPGGGELLANALAAQFRQAADPPFEAVLNGPAPRPLRVKMPCLVLQADPRRGGVLGDAAAAAAVADLGNARLEKIDGAPHALHASHPQQVAEAIRRFARGQSSAEGSSSL